MKISRTDLFLLKLNFMRYIKYFIIQKICVSFHLPRSIKNNQPNKDHVEEEVDKQKEYS
jgi:predicted Zn-dependent protease